MRIFVGLSGGVDSSVAAHILKEQGHVVTGVFMRTWQPGHVPCTAPEDERAAFSAAAHLDIPFLTVDLAEAYRREVGQHFIDGYARGETPNPDVLCNREIKFGAFLQFAEARGADAVATGHYARIEERDGRPALLRGVDEEKDQSYFLALVSPAHLPQIRFPLGTWKKSEVRAYARAHALPNAARKDSQGICFLGEVDLEAFLSPYIPLHPGPVRNLDGEVIGEHRGAALYTLGERHGMTRVTSHTNAPLYVGAIDLDANTITLVPREALPRFRTLLLRDAVDHGAREGVRYEAQARYHGARVGAAARRTPDGWLVTLEEETLVARGQAVVLYEKDRIVLGGILSQAR